MCGSTDLIKQDGVFVCQSCGVKYSVEEAKKMMVEGTVVVEGVVSVDETAKIENWLNLSKNAIDSGNYVEAESYCNKILEIDTENAEVWAIKGKSAGWQTTIAKKRLEEALSCFCKAITLSKSNSEFHDTIYTDFLNLLIAYFDLHCENFKTYASESNVSNITDAVTECSDLKLRLEVELLQTDAENEETKKYYYNLNYVMAEKTYFAALGGYCPVRDIYENSKFNDYATQFEYEQYRDAFQYFTTLLNVAIVLYEGNKEGIIQCYKALIMETKNFSDESVCAYVSGVNYDGSNAWTKVYVDVYVDKLMEYHNKMKELDDSYVVPSRYIPKNNNYSIANSDGSPKGNRELGVDVSTVNNSSSNSGGCYIATCVYGSYDCPQVWTLRRYRDNALASTWYGRAFIRTYYAISPTIVKLFGETNWFKNIWKNKLDKMVSNLQSNGFEDTPYQDKEW